MLNIYMIKTGSELFVSSTKKYPDLIVHTIPNSIFSTLDNGLKKYVCRYNSKENMLISK